MSTVFKKMNEQYIEKNFPKKSFFLSYTKRMKKNQISTLIFCLMFVVGFAYLGYVIYGNIYDPVNNPDGGLTLEGGKILIGIVAGIAILFVILSILQIKRLLNGYEEILKKFAKQSGYTLEEMKEFERQVVQSDTYILDFSNGKLLEKARNAVFSQPDGFLTREYICLGSEGFVRIIKLTDIVGVYLVNEQQKLNIDVGTIDKKVTLSHLSVRVISSKEFQGFADCIEESANALFDLLEERVPNLKCHREVLSQSQYRELTSYF